MIRILIILVLVFACAGCNGVTSLKVSGSGNTINVTNTITDGGTDLSLPGSVNVQK